MRILICEDDEILIKAIEYKFSREKFETVVASDGKQAFSIVEEQDFDLIITDLMMPYFNGLEIVNFIRNKLKTPIIVLTTIKYEKTVLKAFDLGANDYVVKPFSPSELIVRVKHLLKQL